MTTEYKPGYTPDSLVWLAAGLALFVGCFAGDFVGQHRNARLLDRCEKACGWMDEDGPHWSDDTHICACSNGSVHHIRTIVETVRARPDRTRER